MLKDLENPRKKRVAKTNRIVSEERGRIEYNHRRKKRRRQVWGMFLVEGKP